MSVDQLYRFPARMESLGPALALVEAASSGAERATVLRAETAVEELLTNSVVYGAAAQAVPGSVWLGVSVGGAALRLRFEDEFAAFDPMPVIAQEMQRGGNPMDQRPIGGLGLLMVYRLADGFHYVRENGRNCIELSFQARRTT